MSVFFDEFVRGVEKHSVKFSFGFFLFFIFLIFFFVNPTFITNDDVGYRAKSLGYFGMQSKDSVFYFQHNFLIPIYNKLNFSSFIDGYCLFFLIFSNISFLVSSLYIKYCLKTNVFISNLVVFTCHTFFLFNPQFSILSGLIYISGVLIYELQKININKHQKRLLLFCSFCLMVVSFMVRKEVFALSLFMGLIVDLVTKKIDRNKVALMLTVISLCSLLHIKNAQIIKERGSVLYAEQSKQFMDYGFGSHLLENYSKIDLDVTKNDLKMVLSWFFIDRRLIEDTFSQVKKVEFHGKSNFDKIRTAFLSLKILLTLKIMYFIFIIFLSIYFNRKSEWKPPLVALCSLIFIYLFFGFLGRPGMLRVYYSSFYFLTIYFLSVHFEKRRLRDSILIFFVFFVSVLKTQHYLRKVHQKNRLGDRYSISILETSKKYPGVSFYSWGGVSSPLFLPYFLSRKINEVEVTSLAIKQTSNIERNQKVWNLFSKRFTSSGGILIVDFDNYNKIADLEIYCYERLGGKQFYSKNVSVKVTPIMNVRCSI